MVKPGYKQTEVGVIPEDWEVKPLNAVLKKGGLEETIQTKKRIQNCPL